MKRLLFFLLCSSFAFAQYDVLIRNGRVVDGSGNPWIHADVGVIGDRVAFVGHAAADVQAKRTIDATGLIVAPGFIDMLGQSEMNLLVEPQAVSKLTQGITTEITGEGESIAPIDERLIAEAKPYLDKHKLTVDWRTLEGYLQRLEKTQPAINLATFVGATTPRRLVIGDDDRPPTAEELARMQEYVEDAMLEGALGLSTSLIYSPAFYAKTDEILALAKVAARHGGIYATHMRNESDSILPALEEALRIGREAGLPVEIWHLKIAGRQNWGKMPDVLEAIERARASGQDVTADQYPYVASGTSLSTVIPPRYHDGGTEALLKRLRDPGQRAAIRKDLETFHPEWENMWLGVGTPEGILITSIHDPALKRYQGRTIAQIAAAESKDPLDALLDLVLADSNRVSAVFFEMNETDVRLAMQRPWVAVNTDSAVTSPEGPFGDRRFHPRAYGTFPRILGKYVREEKVLRLEDAIRKFTSLAAQRVRLTDRGLLRPGYFADITLFNPGRVLDVATFEDPNRVSVGIQYVLVNGQLALENGTPTGVRAGRPLRGPGYAARQYSPEGLAPRGKVQGVVTDTVGWPLPRTKVSLLDASGKELAMFETKKDGRYEFPLNEPCLKCRITAERMGFAAASYALDYNGANSLWFSFALQKR